MTTKLIEQAIDKWLSLHNFTDEQNKMDYELFLNKITSTVNNIEIINYRVTKEQIVLIKTDKNEITFNINVHPTIFYKNK